MEGPTRLCTPQISKRAACSQEQGCPPRTCEIGHLTEALGSPKRGTPGACLLCSLAPQLRWRALFPCIHTALELTASKMRHRTMPQQCAPAQCLDNMPQHNTKKMKASFETSVSKSASFSLHLGNYAKPWEEQQHGNRRLEGA